MKRKLLFIPFIGICLTLMSSTSMPVADSVNNSVKDTTVKNTRIITASARISVKKMGFFQRIVYRMMLKRLKKQKHMAKEATYAESGNLPLALGSLALVLTFLPLALGSFLVGWAIAVPLSILAIIFGGEPKQGEYKNKAKIGKWFGIASLASMLILLIISVLAWVAFWGAF